MNENDYPSAAVTGWLIVMLCFGVMMLGAVAGAMIQRPYDLRKFRAEAVADGHGVWIVSPDGEVDFRWKMFSEKLTNGVDEAE